MIIPTFTATIIRQPSKYKPNRHLQAPGTASSVDVYTAYWSPPVLSVNHHIHHSRHSRNGSL